MKIKQVTLQPESPSLKKRLGPHHALQKKTAEELAKEQESRLKEVQERVFSKSLGVVEDMLEFRSIDPGRTMEEDPIFQGWAKEFGDEEARAKYRVASAAWAPAKEAPMAIKEASAMAVGIIKARAVEKGGSRVLNVGKVYMAGEIPTLPEREVDND